MPADILSKYAEEVLLGNPILCHLTKSLMNRIYSLIKDVQYAVDIEEDTVYLYVITYTGNTEDNRFIIDETLDMYKEMFDYVGYKINVILSEYYSGKN
ncbi:MAG: hypothetical protein QXS19_08310 [Candidatus Methanomethylicia archaeon]